MNSEKNITQIFNITSTLVQASEHLIQVSNKKEFNQTIYIFTTIVEGITTVQNILNSNNLGKHFTDIHLTLNKLIKDIASNIEGYNLLKVTELTHFSLLPTMKKWNKEIEKSFSVNVSDDISIGVFYSDRNPVEFYEPGRVEALIKEANRVNTELFFFEASDVNFKQKTINGTVKINNEWVKKEFSFPKVIHNIFPVSIRFQSPTERRLSREIPFTSFPIEDKLSLPKRIVENKKFSELLIPFKLATDENVIFDFIDKNKKAVLKPIRGARGENIYFVIKTNNQYKVYRDTKYTIYSKKDFYDFLQEKILKRKNSYLVQRYITARNKAGEPYDFRAHMQKNGEGKWQITKIYPRVGSKKSIQIRINRGTPLRDFDQYLKNEFGQESEVMGRKLTTLALDLAQHVDKLYGLAIDEMGLDIAIDENKRFWIYEANMGPQTRAHEGLRAKTLLEYCNYIGKNQLFYTNQLIDKNKLKGHFDSTKSKLEFEDCDGNLRVGVIIDTSKPMPFLEKLSTCALEKKGVSIYYFNKTDIDYEHMLIRGKIFNGSNWVEKVFEYPNVLYLMMKPENGENFFNLFRDFIDIPTVNRLNSFQLDRLDIFNKLRNSDSISDQVLEINSFNRIKEIFHLLDKVGSIIIKPKGVNSRGVYYIEKINGVDYKLISPTSDQIFNKLTLGHYLKDITAKGINSVQRIFPNSDLNQIKHLKIYLSKNGDGNWECIGNNFQMFRDLISDSDQKDESLPLDEMILKQSIELSKKIVNHLESESNYLLFSTTIELFINEKEDIGVFEVIPEDKDVFIESDEVVQNFLSYCNYIFKENSPE